jgi:hypothetical protein
MHFKLQCSLTFVRGEKMKKTFCIICSLIVLSYGSSAWATLYNLNIDNPLPLAADTVVTNQFASTYDGLTFNSGSLSSLYVNLTGLPSNSLQGATFGTPAQWTDTENPPPNNTGYVSGYAPTSNFLGFNKNSASNLNSGAAISFGSMLDSLNFQLFKPGTNPGSNVTVTVSLYNTNVGGGPLYSSTLKAYDNQAWKSFSYSGQNGDFNLAVVTGGANRFMLDNLSFDAVPTPLPPAMFLFGSGLLGMGMFRKRYC